jgi:hypothetical protein
LSSSSFSFWSSLETVDIRFFSLGFVQRGEGFVGAGPFREEEEKEVEVGEEEEVEGEELEDDDVEEEREEDEEEVEEEEEEEVWLWFSVRSMGCCCVVGVGDLVVKCLVIVVCLVVVFFCGLVRFW